MEPAIARLVSSALADSLSEATSDSDRECIARIASWLADALDDYSWFDREEFLRAVGTATVNV